MAPEGSEERADARETLYRDARRWIGGYGSSADEWRRDAAQQWPREVAAVDERDLRAIAALACAGARGRAS